MTLVRISQHIVLLSCWLQYQLFLHVYEAHQNSHTSQSRVSERNT